MLYSAAKLYGLRAHGIDEPLPARLNLGSNPSDHYTRALNRTRFVPEVAYTRKLDLLTPFGFLTCLHCASWRQCCLDVYGGPILVGL